MEKKMPDSPGNAEQVRIIGEQIADVAISRFASQHPELRQASVTTEIPPPLKWAAAIVSAILIMAATSGLAWLVSSVSEMSVTLARMDERVAGFIQNKEETDKEQSRQIQELQQYHKNSTL